MCMAPFTPMKRSNSEIPKAMNIAFLAKIFEKFSQDVRNLNNKTFPQHLNIVLCTYFNYISRIIFHEYTFSRLNVH